MISQFRLVPVLAVFKRGLMLGVPRFKAAFGHAYVALLGIFVVYCGFINYVGCEAFVIYWTR